MKKIIALLLCISAVLMASAGCTKDLTNEDPGAIIPVYLSTEITNFDPAYSNLDKATTKVLGLIYEGLFSADSKGKPVKNQAKSVKVLDRPSDDYYAIEITLKNAYWSDGTQVQAADYIYACKRILESEFRGEAASMLFAIKNARDVNRGDLSIDDLGVTDVASNVLRIEFEGKTDYNKFYEYLASPMLVPLRENAVDKVKADWSSSSQILVGNGPFFVRTYTPGEKLVLERNRYYYRNIEEDSIKKSVTPYRLVINYKKTAEENLADFESGDLVYLSEIALSKRADYRSKASVSGSMSVLSFIFNTKTAPFDNADVRNALSLALDRSKIADTLVFAKPAAGLISDGVFEKSPSSKKSFRSGASEELISASANVDSAKALLKKAGVNGGDIKLTIHDRDTDKAVAEYVKTVWESLGFKVTVEALGYKKYTNDQEYDLVSNLYNEAYDAGNFDVILTDNLMLSTDAFPNLAMYAKAFASGVIDNDDYELTPHISGYYSEEYDKKITEAFAETDAAKRAALLHEAEAMLIKDMPVMPLVQLQDAYLKSSDISKLGSSYYGYSTFTKAVLRNISKYPDNVGYETAAGDKK